MTSWLKHTARGVCMGIADIIPGVSGGTLALILGIYERFIGAVSSIGPAMLMAVFSREFWRRLKAGLVEPGSEGIDEVGTYAGQVLFLAFLFVGIACAILVGARFIPGLLDRYPAPMRGFFFGLVLASVVIPWRMLRQRGPLQGSVFVGAAIATFVFVALPIDQSSRATGEVTVVLGAPAVEGTVLTPENTLFMTDRHGGAKHQKREVVFAPLAALPVAAGATEVVVPVVARMAGSPANVAAGALTIVDGGPPGATVRQAAPMSGGVDPALWFVFLAGFVAISAMVLPGISGSFILLMLGLYHYMTFTLRAVVYDRDMGALTVAAVFGVALVLGITTFSRFLAWLLARHHDVTLAALVGLMVGSLRKIWPFQATDVSGLSSNVLPESFDGLVIVTAITFIAGVVVVSGLERLGRASTPAPTTH